MRKLFLFLSVLILIVCLFLLRFYNLNWGTPYYFHPDERNIASSITQLQFPSQMNPHFFAYGSLPIYIVYFTGILMHFLSRMPLQQLWQVSFSEGIIINRFYSAILSAFLPILLFIIGKKMHNRQTGTIAFLLGVFSVGFIQFAHFGTFEMWSTFFFTLLFLDVLLFLKNPSYKYLFISVFIIGVLLSIKISNSVIIPILIFLQIYKAKNEFRKLNKFRFQPRNIITFLIISLLLYAFIVILTVIFSPYTILDSSSFIHSITYESSVAMGTLPVFYTQEFISQNDILFQLLHVYPFLLNPFVTLLFIFSFIYCIYLVFRFKSKQILFLLLFFIILFVSQAILFVKWTRYMIPTLPFIYLLIAYTLTHLQNQFKTKKFQLIIIISTLELISAIFAISYVITAFVETDTREIAAIYAHNHIPKNATIVSEIYDLGIVPFNSSFENIKLYNFYDSDILHSDIAKGIGNADYIILPSQRIIKTRLLKPKIFPISSVFYQHLINGEAGYKLMYITPCDIFCRITYLNNPIYSYEETASVFDRPTIFIFKKSD